MKCCDVNMEPEQSAARLDASIVFATRDRGPQLRRTLAAYLELETCGIDWELVVIDNGSQDETAQILREAEAKLPLIHLFVPEPGQNRARNQALSALHGDIVIFTDDDVLPDSGCLRAYLEAARRWPKEAIFGARIDPEFPPETPVWMQSPEFEFSSTAFARYRPGHYEGPVKRHPYGPSFAVRRRALGKQRFNAHLGPQAGAYAMGGEGDFLRRIAGRRYQFIYVPTARVRHIVRPDQITSQWIFARARKKGRGQVYMPSSRNPTRLHIRGMPLKLVTSLSRSWLRYQLFRALNMREAYTRHRIQFELRYGQARERFEQHHRHRLLPPHNSG